MNNRSLAKSIRYPKRIKRDGNKPFGVVEPTRKNMYDVIIENFDTVDRVSDWYTPKNIKGNDMVMNKRLM